MIRPPTTRAMMLVMTAAISLGALPALGEEKLTYKGWGYSSSTETRMAPSEQTVETRGTKEATGTSRLVEEKVLGAASKLMTESEVRNYQTPVTGYVVNREEKRLVSTITMFYTRTTTTTVVDQKVDKWKLGGYLVKGYGFSTNLQYFPARSDGDYRSASQVLTIEGVQTKTTDDYDSSNVIAVNIVPHNEGGYLHAFMRFYKDSLQFMGGTIICHGSDKANIREAKIIRYADHDAIEYRLDCALNQDFWPNTWCETDRTVWTLHLKGKLIEPVMVGVPRTETSKEEPYETISHSYGPWEPTGRTERGAALPLRYEKSSEKTVLRQWTAVNDRTASKGLAAAGNDIRKTFSADKSAGAPRAALSGNMVRQALGANRVTPSSTGVSKGGGAPSSSGGLPIPLPIPTPRPSPTPSPAPTPIPIPYADLYYSNPWLYFGFFPNSPLPDNPYRQGMQ